MTTLKGRGGPGRGQGRKPRPGGARRKDYYLSNEVIQYLNRNENQSTEIERQVRDEMKQKSQTREDLENELRAKVEEMTSTKVDEVTMTNSAFVIESEPTFALRFEEWISKFPGATIEYDDEYRKWFTTIPF